MQKYINNKKTFVWKKEWIPYGTEAIILEEKNGSCVLLFKDIGKLEIEKGKFKEYFVKNGKASKEDLYEFYSSENKIKKSLFIEIIEKYYKGKLKKLLASAIEKAYMDAYNTPGSASLTIKKFEEFLLGTYQIGPLEEIGSPFFNRRARWSVIADVKKWSKRGKPAPIGIRPEDYAPLKECNAIFTELVRQIFSMKDIPFIPKEIEKLVGKIKPRSHKCRYCGEIMSINLFKDQKYKAKEHALNFCHIDPSEKRGRTNKNNIYFGHTSCNRTQGGLSERGRIIDGLRLLNLYKDNYKKDKEIRKNIKKAYKYFKKV